ncbi:MAG: hypothetical protein PHX07_04905 [Candidatus Marinimicrobia bacterium]|jgi:hypothetical protein|nr:hypothetical protein [Candidatus Neomarinimicrobiota bacterium]MDD4961554.1 hypothetical protein [Candidatus Neomarinimicrobiota bacterium]MDD5710316.1 hypothetical protein [Candidatus Neomarinimicrobiota bacterium]MDX9778187.1 hypothetical protein [bacterium]
MFWKRTIPAIIVGAVGVIMLLSWFIPHAPFGELEIHATQWYDIIASFAMILGALNLLKLQGRKIVKRQKGWPYSLAAVSAFFMTLAFGFLIKGGYFPVLIDAGDNPEAVYTKISEVTAISLEEVRNLYSYPSANGERIIMQKAVVSKRQAQRTIDELETLGATVSMGELKWGSHVQGQNTYYRWVFYSFFTPLSATMFALLAFFVASASYRAFKIRNAEATVLLLSGIFIMLGRVPLGAYLTAWTQKIPWLSWLHLPTIQEWLYQYPNAAGARAIMIGIGLGIVGTSLRVILGIEKSFMGGD